MKSIWKINYAKENNLQNTTQIANMSFTWAMDDVRYVCEYSRLVIGWEIEFVYSYI